MLARLLLGTVTAGAMVAPAIAGSMTADEARKFVAGKVFAFTCVDGTRGAGRILDDMGAAGAVQFSGSGPVRHIRLPGNTLQIRGQNVCASIKGMPFEPCFNLDKKDDRSFRGSVSGLGAFAYCDFQHQGGATMLMARAVARPRPARAAAPVDTSHTEVAARVETPRVERSKVEPVKAEAAKADHSRSDTAKSESTKADAAPELRRSTD
ncbi:hypothetical protein HL667_11920 [Bradyrhizobium sp. 83012]|uniref:Uncharacterized protein n=1 Tax=Bradyrhizobium aeschynomenes TaxID=2734909 RepID=A0ABX2CBU1_9BRAD|nr:hypothetical protein [Bradyrhizobium aeschynomenes]NPU65702.1 hypothetical protein [Bradyrhizobium aeschynomenes]